jgi:hypothetical protein
VLLWDAYFYFAFAVFALILLHVAATLFHAPVRRDGVLHRDGSVSTHDKLRLWTASVPAEKDSFLIISADF